MNTNDEKLQQAEPLSQEQQSDKSVQGTNVKKAKAKKFLPHFFLALIVAALIGVILFFTLTQASFNDFLMGTDVAVTSKGLSALSVNGKIRNEIARADALLSAEKEGSDIYRINRAKANEWIAVDALTISLLKRAVEFYQESDGAFNVFLYPVIKAWEFDSASFTLKTKSAERIEEMKEEADALAPFVENNFTQKDGRIESENFIIDPNENRVLRKNESAMIDLGGMAKGYAADYAFRLAKESEIDHLLCVLGGSSISAAGREYRVGVADPNNSENTVAELLLADNAVSTSGVYLRQYADENGNSYHHIIGKNLRPADTGILSVTVAGADATVCDFLSTAAVVCGAEKALELVERFHYGILIIFNDKTYKISGEITCSFSDKSYTERL